MREKTDAFVHIGIGRNVVGLSDIVIHGITERNAAQINFRTISLCTKEIKLRGQYWLLIPGTRDAGISIKAIKFNDSGSMSGAIEAECAST